MKYFNLNLNYAVEIYGDHVALSVDDLDKLVHDLKTRLGIAILNAKLPAYLELDLEESIVNYSLD